MQEMSNHLYKQADKYDPARASIPGFVVVVLSSWIKTRVRYLKRKRRGAGRHPPRRGVPRQGSARDLRARRA